MRCEDPPWSDPVVSPLSDVCSADQSQFIFRCVKWDRVETFRHISSIGVGVLQQIFGTFLSRINSSSMFIIVWSGFYIAGILVIHDGRIVVLNRISAPVLSTITPLPLCSQQLYNHFIVRRAGCLVFSNSVYPTRVKISIAKAPISATELQPGNYGCCMGENKRLHLESMGTIFKETSGLHFETWILLLKSLLNDVQVTFHPPV